MTRKKTILGGNDTVKVAVAQIAPAFMDKDRTLDRACAAIREAAAAGAQLITFPEAFACGYPYWTEGWDSEIERWREARVRWYDAAIVAPSDDTDRIAAAARSHGGIYVVIGCNELDERPGVNTVYNSLLFFGPDGSLFARHRKLIPTFAERTFWGVGPGDDLIVHETDIGRLGGLICGEHLMTLARASLIQQGEELHIAVWPGMFAASSGGPALCAAGDSQSFYGYAAVRQHATEAGAFVLSAVGSLSDDDVPDDFSYKGLMNIEYAKGGSQIVAPSGTMLAGPDDHARIVYASCEAAAIKTWKAVIDTVGHYSRPDVLRLIAKGERGWRTVGGVSSAPALSRDALARAADAHDIDDQAAEALAAEIGLEVQP